MSPESTASLSILILLGLLVAFIFTFFFPLKFSSPLILSTINCSLCLYFIFCTPFQAFSICLPLSSISRGTCFVLCFPLYGFSYLIPWFWQPPANFWFPNPHLKSRSFTHIQIHLSPVSWVCQGSSVSACP